MKLRLLVADDEELARAAIRKMVDSFFDEFDEVVEAARGDEVVETARRTRPHVVLLDVRMPGLNGLDAAAQILAANPDTRIVIVTAYDRFSLAQRAVNLGLDGYLLKPLIEEELRRTLGEVIRRIDRDAGRGRRTAASAPDQGPLAGSELVAMEDRIIRSVLRGLVADPAEMADGLVSVWEASGRDARARARALGFALAREAERFACDGPAPVEAEVGASPRDALAQALLAWTGAADRGSSGARRRILDWLCETPPAELSLGALASHLRGSPASASRMFREEIGQNFAAYVCALRMERAAIIAARETLTIEELGRRVGYSDPTYFARLFKEHMGISPRDFAHARRQETAGPGQESGPGSL